MVRIFSRLISLIALFLAFQAMPLAQSARAACIAVSTPAGLLDIASDMTASYCLTKDIDASSLGTVNTLAGGADFTGTLDGRGYTIRNLTLNGNLFYSKGFIGTLAGTGLIQNLTLANVKAEGTGNCCTYYFGTLVGINRGTIRNVSAILIDLKTVKADRVGGLVGQNAGIIQQSYTTGRIVDVGAGGGLVAWNTFGGLVERSYSAVRIEAPCHSNNSDWPAAGLVSRNEGSVRQSFAVGQIRLMDCSALYTVVVGGLTGTSTELIQSYSTSGVTALGSPSSSSDVGGLTGWSTYTFESFAAGRIDCDTCGDGLIGNKSAFGTTLNSYWDILTSTKLTSDSGTGLGTATLKSRLRSGFDPDMWGISSRVSYPYLKVNNTYLPRVRSTDHAFPPRLVSFKSTLALLSNVKGLFTIFPIGQLQPFQYRNYRIDFASTACKAAVYTMIGRAIGEMNPTININYPTGSDPLSVARIDYFMDALGFARWPTFNRDIASKVAFYAGATRIYNPVDANAAVFDHADIVNSLDRRRVVLLQGTTGGTYLHWMLVTALMKDAAGNVTHLVANDPELGQQVLIDMNPSSATYKQVTDPPNYSGLAFFTFTASRYFSAWIYPGP